MRRRLSALAYRLSLLMCVVTLVLWIAPVPPWRDNGRRTFYFSVETHHVLRVNVFRTTASPVVSPPQNNVRAFVNWQMALPSGPVFHALGFQVAHYPWFKGSWRADGSEGLTHVGTHWSVDFPFLPLVLLFALPSVISAILAWRRRIAMSRMGRCTACGYNLTANVSGVCPECGLAVAPNHKTPILPTNSIS